jgi:ankyrin repeat protein
MPADDERCAEQRRVMAIDAAFRAGDYAALLASVDDPAVVPNGAMPLAIGPCLTYAIYHSPLALVRELLERGADPDQSDGDGFPPLLAALSTLSSQRGSPPRSDVPALLSLLLDHGADPDVRGLNDWTPLHMAVAMRSLECTTLLLQRGADPTVRTRIDDFDTPREFAVTVGAQVLADALAAAEGRR